MKVQVALFAAVLFLPDVTSAQGQPGPGPGPGDPAKVQACRQEAFAMLRS